MKPVPRCLLAGAVLAAALLSGCATYSPAKVTPGMDAAQVQQLMGGPPNARHANPGGGTRLEYARGPMGFHTYMIDLDPGGRVTGWQQVLTENNFNAITPGMPVQEMLRRIGRPAYVRGGGWQPGQVWSYRYEGPFCLWWQISVVGDRTADAAYGPDPRCERNERFGFGFR
ncbi:hypothetical protein [Azohydromonas aeria]|uniref:hypothetical protein n=1 Tax=Azohydromonas aeria TaxID=2590212 RepID=UPI0012FA3491|nr:hypothetical protein [Azohydromonas aeria]